MKKVTLNEAVELLNKSKTTTLNITKKKFTLDQASQVANQLNIDFNQVNYTLEDYLEGINVELEHGRISPETNVTNDDLLATGKIALAHLNETPFYYHEDIGIEAWEKAIEAFKGNPSGRKIRIF